MRNLILLLLIIGLGACQKTEPRHAAQKNLPFVEIAKVERKPLKASRLVTGSLEAISTVRIFNQEQGRLLSLPYSEGDAVKKDQLVAQIDASLIQAELNKAKATLHQAKVNLRRITSLQRKKLASDDELSRAQTALELAQSEQVLLQTRFAHTRIRAPFDGVISERLQEPGDVVAVHSHILTIIDPSKLKIVVHLSELLLAHIKTGQAVQVRIDALGERHFPARVTRLYPTIDPRNRQGTMELQLQTVPKGARPGQLCRVMVNSETTPRRAIPFLAVRHDSKGEYVYRLDAENKVEKIHVQTGIQLGAEIEILAGLKEGDRVVSKGFIGLNAGRQVQIKPIKKPLQDTQTPPATTHPGKETVH